MIGKIYITRNGYDPQRGKHIKDPYLGDVPTMGACRPDFRKILNVGDHVFMITGKVKEVNQFLAGGFEVAEKILTSEAYKKFPSLRLKKLADGQLDGNIVIDAKGKKHPLDDHKLKTFDQRRDDYIIGKNIIRLDTEAEIERGRAETLERLCDILKKKANRPIDLVPRSGVTLSENQVLEIRNWLEEIKRESN